LVPVRCGPWYHSQLPRYTLIRFPLLISQDISSSPRGVFSINVFCLDRLSAFSTPVPVESGTSPRRPRLMRLFFLFSWFTAPRVKENSSAELTYRFCRFFLFLLDPSGSDLGFLAMILRNAPSTHLFHSHYTPSTFPIMSPGPLRAYVE